MLPIHPGPGEQARRLVRHGMADVLAWLGDEVGPGPEEATHHAIVTVDPATSGQAVLYVSRDFMQAIGRTSR
jgi:hypothetical protein